MYLEKSPTSLQNLQRHEEKTSSCETVRQNKQALPKSETLPWMCHLNCQPGMERDSTTKYLFQRPASSSDASPPPWRTMKRTQAEELNCTDVAQPTDNSKEMQVETTHQPNSALICSVSSDKITSPSITYCLYNGENERS